VYKAAAEDRAMMCGEPQCAAEERAGGDAALVAERRRYPRRNLYLPIRVHRKDAGPASRVEATCTVNVNGAGLYFITRMEYPLGISLAIEFGDAASAGRPPGGGNAAARRRSSTRAIL
jgi:hypothetical protein